MNKLSFSAVIVLLLSVMAVRFSVSQIEGEIIPDAPHPPHIRATLERPEVHINEEMQRKAFYIGEHLAEQAEEIADTIREKVTGVKHKVETKKEEIKGKVHGAKETVSEKVDHIKDSVKKAAHDAKESIKHFGEEVLEKVPHPHKRALEDKAEEFVETLSEGGVPRKVFSEEIKHVVKKRIHWTERIANVKDMTVDWIKYFFFGKPYTRFEVPEAEVRTIIIEVPVEVAYPGQVEEEKLGEKLKQVELPELEETVEQLKKKTAEKLKEEKEKLAEKAEKIKEKLEAGKEIVEEGAEKIGEKAKSAKDLLADKIKHIKESAKEAVYDIKEKVGGKKEEMIEGWRDFAGRFHEARDRLNSGLPIEYRRTYVTQEAGGRNEIQEDYHIKYEYTVRRTVKPVDIIQRDVIPTH